jgi:cell division inhibitor SepF
MWRKAMIHLGLGDDEFGDEPVDDAPDADRAPARDGRPGAARPQPGLAPGLPPTATYADEPSAIGTVRPINPRPEGADPGPPLGQTVQPSGHTIRPRPQTVRPVAVTANARPHVVVASSFNQAQNVADKFKTSQPVVMNLVDADRELSRRLIDFASGLCYGLGGQMERVASQVYLVSPSSVEVTEEERDRLRDRGYQD